MPTDLRLLERDDHAAVARNEERTPKLALTWLDIRALIGLVGDDPKPLVDWVTASASSMIGDDKVNARERLLARAVAGERAKMLLYQALLDEKLAAGEERAALLVDKVLTSATRRLTQLLAEMRHCSTARSQVVAVGHAEQIIIGSGGEE
jgi:hypothetical protein